MVKPLGWLAAGGLGAGIVFLSLAWATGGKDLGLAVGSYFGGSCDTAAVPDFAPSERRWKWGEQDSVEIALPATVRWRGGEGDELIARGAPDIIGHIKVSGGRITLDCRRTGRLREVEIVLPGRALRRVGLAGSGTVVMENLAQPDLTLAITGSGDVRAGGAVDRVTVSITGSGHAKLADLATKQLTVNITGHGNIEAAPKEDADINISGSGNVRLLTRPARLSSHIAGSGRITQPPLESADGKK